MNKSTSLLISLLITLSSPLQAQHGQGPDGLGAKPIKTTFYYNLNWELTTQENSYYRREAMFDFSDMVFDGVYRDYNKDNVMIAEGNYAHGVRAGLQTEYFPNRKVKSTMEFENGDFILWEHNDPEKKDSIRHGTGTFTMAYYYMSGLVSQPVWKLGIVKGAFRSGKRTGTWVYESLTQVKTDEEYYIDGKLKTRIHFSDQGTVELDYKKSIYTSLNSLLTENLVYDQTAFSYLNEFFEKKPTYPASFSRQITYPGGIKNMLLIMAQRATVPPGEVCIIRIRVNEHGKINKYSVVVSADPKTDQEAVNAINAYENRFLPMMKNGQPFVGSINLPLSSGPDWIEFVKMSRVEDLVQMQ